MDRLFQSFSQVDASTTRKYGGTGLGLAISKRLSEMMGGTMWVESEVGKGSTFNFTIQTQAAESAPLAYLSEVQPQLRGKRVLVVDDNPTNRKILRLQAQSWGMEPVTAASGPEALELIRQGAPFDLAPLDMQMPEMDGQTLAEEIRRCRDAQELPLIMLTSLGLSEPGVRKELFAAFLAKPVKASQLYNSIVDVFAGETALWARRATERVAADSKFDSQMGEQSPLRILVAEDHPTNQKLALLVLGRLGYRADITSNGLEAVESVRRQPYDKIALESLCREV
jgi:CheY-like chemotaxis protein